jgi:uncharacterized OB-fold protein
MGADMNNYLKPLPSKDLDAKPFWESCKSHSMALQICVSCGRFRYPPRSLCPKCHSTEAELRPVSGRGRVYVSLVMCHSYGPAWEKDVPYNVSIVELEEGVHMWSNVVGCSPDEVKIGDDVTIIYDDVTEEIALPKFRRT